MKHLIFAVALLGATASTALAQFPPPPTEAVVKEGKKNLISKTAELEAAVSRNSADKAEAVSMDVLHLMKRRVAETRYTAEAHKGAERDVIMKHMLEIESMVGDYMTLNKDVAANGKQLVAKARQFTAQY